MSSPVVHTSIVAFAENCLLVHFKGHAPEERSHLLQRSVADWLKDNPTRRALRTKSIKSGGKIVGLIVWLDPEVAPAKSKPQIIVHKTLADCFPREHLEAMIDRALQVFVHHPVDVPLAAINRQGVTVVMMPQTNQVHALPLEDMHMDDASRSRVDAWMTNPKTNLYVIELPHFRID